jgi:hypothetical protein
MTFSIKYQPLFKVNIWNNYFLDKGAVSFNSMSDGQKSKQIENYDIKSVFSIIPTFETQKLLKGNNLMLKLTNSGFVVLTKMVDDEITPFVSLEDDLNFSFLIQIKDRLYYNYTDLKMENSNKLYFLCNRKPDLKPADFPLLKKEGTNAKLNDTYILSTENQKLEYSRLQSGEKNNLMALARIYMRGENNNLSVITNEGKLKDPYQVFGIQIDNRKTTWRYIFKTDQEVKGGDNVKIEGDSSKILITKNEKPLTQSGFISVELGGVELPNPDTRIVKPDTSNNKYYSEIYM